jgi:hypothetical protein
MDKHLNLLCAKHLETKFFKVGGAKGDRLSETADAPPVKWRAWRSAHAAAAAAPPSVLQHPAACSRMAPISPPLASDPPPPPPPFPQINAEKSPYLVEKLKVWMLPTLALIKNEKVGPGDSLVRGGERLPGRGGQRRAAAAGAGAAAE